MQGRDQKVAIVLHGPPTAGKTVVSEEIQGRFRPGKVQHISLDEGWLPHERRYAGGQNRYADLRNVKADIVVVELASGEPPDLAFRGATRAAHEWVHELRNAGRAVFPFLLWTDWAQALRRVMDRSKDKSEALMRLEIQIGPVHAL